MKGTNLLLLRLGSVLGKNESWLSIATSIALTLVIVTAAYSIFSFLDPYLYFFESRVTHYTSGLVDDMLDYRTVVIMLSSSLIIWIALSIASKLGRILLASILGLTSVITIYGGEPFVNVIPLVALPLGGILFLTNRITKFEVLVPDTSSLLGSYLSIAFIVLAVLSILYSIGTIDGDIGGDFSDYSYLLVTFFSLISPVVIFLLVFSFPAKIIWEETRSKVRYVSSIFHLDLQPAILPRRLILLSLGSAIALSVVLVLIPSLFHDHAEGSTVGVDTLQYVKVLERIGHQDNSTEDVFWFLFRDYSNGDRPFTILFISAITSLLGSDLNTGNSIELALPIMLAPSLAVVIFHLARQIGRNDLLAILCLFLTTISPQILIGIYAGFYANWLALVIANLAALFMFAFLRTSKYAFILLFGITLATVIFTHTYTYTIFVLVFVIFLISALFLKFYKRRTVLIVLFVIILTVLIDLSRSTILGSSSGVSLNLGVAESTEAGFLQFSSRWSNLVGTVQVHVGGIFGNAIFFMGLAFSGIILIGRKTNQALITFLISFMSIGILPLFFGDRIVMARVLYNIPFQIPAAITLIWLAKHGNTGRLATVALFLISLAVSIRILTNFDDSTL